MRMEISEFLWERFPEYWEDKSALDKTFNSSKSRKPLKVPRVQNWLPTRGICGHHLTIEECDAKLLCPPFSLAVVQHKWCTTSSFLIMITHHFLCID
jgi:hypothetical protein